MVNLTVLTGVFCKESVKFRERIVVKINFKISTLNSLKMPTKTTLFKTGTLRIRRCSHADLNKEAVHSRNYSHSTGL